MDTLVTNYRQVSEVTTARLGDIKRDLDSRPERDQAEISMAADRATRDEDDLKSSLERTRKNKLSALQHKTHHHRPPSAVEPLLGDHATLGMNTHRTAR